MERNRNSVEKVEERERERERRARKGERKW